MNLYQMVFTIIILKDFGLCLKGEFMAYTTKLALNT